MLHKSNTGVYKFTTYVNLTRDHRVGIFNFGTDRVRVLQKTSGSGSGTDRVRVFAPYIWSIGYYRVTKILIRFFRVYQYGIFFLNIWMLEYKTFLKSIHIDSMFTYLDFLWHTIIGGQLDHLKSYPKSKSIAALFLKFIPVELWEKSV